MALSLSACGSSPEDKPQGASASVPQGIDAALMPYFQSFANGVGINFSGVAGVFGSLPYPTVGRCTKVNTGERYITIDPYYWSQVNENTKEELMYHELGHCVLNLAHNETKDANNCPISVMFPNTFGYDACFGANKAYYFSELRSHL